MAKGSTWLLWCFILVTVLAAVYAGTLFNFDPDLQQREEEDRDRSERTYMKTSVKLTVLVSVTAVVVKLILGDDE